MASPSSTKRESVDAFQSPIPGALSPRASSPLTNHEWPKRGSSTRSQRRESAASTVSSVGGSLDISVHGRLGSATTTTTTTMTTTADTSRNAISTLLQPPIVRTGLLPHTSAPSSTAHRPPSTRDIPPVTLTNIAHVDSSAFEPYLAQVASLFDARSRTEVDEAASSQWRKDKSAGKDDDDVLAMIDEGSGVKSPRLVSRGSISGMISPAIESPPLLRRRSSGGGVSRRNQPAVTPLSAIPGIYLDQNFHLENPRTFDVVTERSEVVRTPQPPNEEVKAAANGFVNGSPVTPRKALATNAILQEKLSWYLDTVEIHLISSISAASKSFFAALGSLKELHSEAAESVAKIRILREDLEKLDKDMAIGRLEIVRMQQRRDNLRKLGNAAMQLQCVMKGATHCEELVDKGDLETSLEHLSVLEEFACGQFDADTASRNSWLCPELPDQMLDLRQLKALQGFGNGMDVLRSRIGAGFQSRFMEALLVDLRQHVTRVPNSETLNRWTSASQRARGLQVMSAPTSPAYLQTNSELRKQLSITLTGLTRSRYTATATAAFRDAVMREMKSLIRQNLPSSSDDDMVSVTSASTRSGRPLTQQDKSAILAHNLRALDPEDAEDLLSKTYCAVGEAVRRLQVQVKVLLDVSSGKSLFSPTTSTGLRSPPKSPHMTGIDSSIRSASPNLVPSNNLPDELMQTLDLSSLLGQAVDVAQTQIVKILKVRTEQTTHLSLPRFLRYFTINRLFADECEAVSGRSGASLKGVVNNQISEFITIFAEAERQQLAHVMDGDKWDQKDFNDDDNLVLSQILEGRTSDPSAWVQRAYIWEENQPQSNGISSKTAAFGSTPESNGNTTNTTVTTTNTATKDKARSAFIGEEKFILAESAVLIIHSIAHFQTLIACIPSLAPEVSTALLNYLKLFNSRSCQLVLGAGATRSNAALKNINTKHLALASQALSFVIALLPYIREFVRHRPGMTGAQAVAEYDKVRRLYQDHQTSIHEKLVDIMSARAASHVAAMRDIDWEAEGRSSEGPASPHMETLTKETTNLHRVLSRYLPEVNVKMIMTPVFANYKAQWGQAFKDARVTKEAGKRRLQRDADLFSSRLGKIEGSGNLGGLILGIVKAKQVAGGVDASPAAPATPQKPRNGDPATSTNGNQEASEEESKNSGEGFLTAPSAPEGAD